MIKHLQNTWVKLIFLLLFSIWKVHNVLNAYKNTIIKVGMVWLSAAAQVLKEDSVLKVNLIVKLIFPESSSLMNFYWFEIVFNIWIDPFQASSLRHLRSFMKGKQDSNPLQLRIYVACKQLKPLAPPTMGLYYKTFRIPFLRKRRRF